MALFTGLSIIIPTVDETQAIAGTVEIIDGIVSPDEIREMIIIYSNRSDESHISALHELQSRYPALKIRVIPQKDSGLGNALYYGCSEARGSHFFIAGADMENEITDLRKMLDLSKKNPDAVISTSRKLTEDGFAEYPRYKRVLSDIFEFAVHILFATRQTDITYAYQITPKEYFNAFDFSENHSAFVLELALMTELCGYRFIEIPTKIHRRKEGISHSSVTYYVRFIGTALRMFIKHRLKRKNEKKGTARPPEL